jgi:thymidine phosphorylase
VLENDARAPADLRQKSLRLAGRLIECDPAVRGGDGFAIARDILESGRALAKMKAIIAAQGEKLFDHKHPKLGALTLDVCATASGLVTGIDNLQVARIARLAGAPKVIQAGVELFRKLGDAVANGDILYRVYAGFQTDLAFARQACAKSTGYLTGGSDDVPQVFVEF